jgi:hypothetical protein
MFISKMSATQAGRRLGLQICQLKLGLLGWAADHPWPIAYVLVITKIRI